MEHSEGMGAEMQVEEEGAMERRMEMAEGGGERVERWKDGGEGWARVRGRRRWWRWMCMARLLM